MRAKPAVWIAVRIACVSAIGLAVPALAGQTEIDAQMKILTGDNAEARQQARAALTAMGPEAIKSLLTAVAHSNRSVGKAAEMTLFDIVVRAGRVGAEPDRLAAATSLAAELSNAALPQQTRAYVCLLLSYIGREEAVPALVMAMRASDIAEMARWSLSHNPTPQALDALHEALAKSDPSLRIGLINTVGARTQRRSVPVLAEQLKSQDEAVRIAAMEAISHIPDPFAIDILRPRLESGSPKERQTAREAWLRLGEALLTSDRPCAANVIFKEALKHSGPVQDRCAAIIGIGRAEQADAVSTLLATLRTTDQRDVRGAVVQALEDMKGPEVSAQIASALAGTAGKPKGLAGLFGGKRLSPAAQVALLRVLIARKEKVDPAGVIAVLQSSDETARIAALECLAEIGDESAAPALADSLKKPEGPERSAATHALIRLKAPKGLAWLHQTVAKDDLNPDYRCVLIAAVGERNDPGSTALLSDILKRNQPEDVRVASFKALGRLAQLESLPALLAGVDKESGKDRDAAEVALGKLRDEATEPMIQALAKATPFQKAALLKALGLRKSPKITALLMEGYASADGRVKAAAVEGLRRLADPTTLKALEEAAAKGPAQNVAAAGMIRIAEKIEKDNRAEALRVYQQALKWAPQDRERQAALNALARLADASSFDVVRPFLTEGNVKAQAAEAMMAIGVTLGDDRKTDGIEAIKTALAISPSSRLAKPATEKLIKWGVAIDPAREAGFVTHWWVIGPFPNPEKKMFDQKYTPEDTVDLAAKIKVGDHDLAWKKVHITSFEGILDLREAVAGADNVGCYCYAEVASDKAQDVLFKMGSDDDIICWVNGAKIHANKVDRGLGVDSDVVKARLNQGTNRILLKVLNSGGPWQACLRITTPENQPLKLEQRQK